MLAHKGEISSNHVLVVGRSQNGVHISAPYTISFLYVPYRCSAVNRTVLNSAQQAKLLQKMFRPKKIYEIKYKNQFDEKRLNLRRKMENNQKNS